MATDSVPIHDFAREGDFAGVLRELDSGVAVDVRNPTNDWSPLMEAVASSQTTVGLVRLLIQRGADVNAVADNAGPIVSAASVDLMKQRIEATNDPASADALENKKSLLAIAAEMELLSKHLTSGVTDTVLSLGAQSGNFEKIEALLDAGANIHYLLPHGYSVLIDVMHGREIAFDSQLLPVLSLLVARGANLDVVSTYSESALSVACLNGRFDAIQLLLDAGANPAPLAWTPLMHAIALGSLDDVRRQVDGTDLTARDFWSCTPWLLSIKTGDVEKAKLLLAAGADRSDHGRCGHPPLSYPIVNRHTEMLRWLLSVGLDSNDTDQFGGTPLMDATEAPHVSMARNNTKTTRTSMFWTLLAWFGPESTSPRNRPKITSRRKETPHARSSRS